MSSGVVVAVEVAGATAVSDRAIMASQRMRARGRRWSDRTRLAAKELIEHGSTALIGGSERSRLKSRLRAGSVSELAYHLLSGRLSLWRSVGERLELDSALAAELGLSATGGIAVRARNDARAGARKQRLVPDGEGDVLLIDDEGRVVEVLGLYAFGGSRESAAAERWLRSKIEAL
ncbi:hypothetical protein [Agrococcus sp. ARC_14]|uniref:hypothetical protein n=1 Tax=Agrococcus sp. ARC_14 TaxID=2919927 RepID=UPI001F06FFDC|nr:hypothetical protein [Agrococcus sp. ARC_14]MCH1882412.1 hypothetical protein [Agrococcus sp. ARC_14]